MHSLLRLFLPTAIAACTGIACARPPATTATTTPVYSKTTGKLEQLVADQNADGKPDVRAYMDGATLRRIEIDRDRDGRPDRWEFYSAPTTEAGAAKTAAGQAEIARAEEANGPDARVTRREEYEHGELRRVEEDTDLDGRMDKWETYAGQRLASVDLDLDGAGRPTQRLTYAADGSVTSTPVLSVEGR